MANEIQQKSQVIHTCTNKRQQRKPVYTLHGHVLEAADSAKYFGVNISDKTAAKASSTLGFLRRNLINCTKEVKERTCNTFVLPTLEYAASYGTPTSVRTSTNWNKSSEEEHVMSRITTGTERQAVSPEWSGISDGRLLKKECANFDF